MRKLLLPITFLALSACGGQVTDAVNSDVTPAKLQNDTAVYFATSRSRVKVGKFEQTVLGTKYKARVAGTLYDCHYFRSSISCNRTR